MYASLATAQTGASDGTLAGELSPFHQEHSMHFYIQLIDHIFFDKIKAARVTEHPREKKN